MALIYPRSAQFQQPVKPFDFSPELRLWVLPFDLDTDALTVGEAVDFARCLNLPTFALPRLA
ncbi:hypothetical protein D3C78_1602190 [compost metagenome]